MRAWERRRRPGETIERQQRWVGQASVLDPTADHDRQRQHEQDVSSVSNIYASNTGSSA
ncbi:MAG: hypothetical protein KatS3mg057_1017 [Herpetosiphonaceae bacterium]|nr:MAG: hypothetical protein KatS3mg057_1017 [Herpetosiphonaceae bacterium]